MVKSILNKIKNKINDINEKRMSIILGMVLTMLIATLPMGLSKVWNGTIIDHKQQYEVLTESILNGHLYLDYGEGDISEDMLNFEDIYDYEKREAADFYYRWDHAYYKGHYYMYFGVVPVFLTFIPIKLLTGITIRGYHVTQIYAIVYIIGIFLLFALIKKIFNKKLSTTMYILLSSTFCIGSLWYITTYPMLYNLAIVSGLAFAVWSIYFFMTASYNSNSLKESVIYLTLGGLCGALIFGCRPPIGLINIIYLPIVYSILKKYGFTVKNILKVSISLIPYVIVAALLMAYNYARFGSILEFGQTYMLTSSTQLNLTDRTFKLGYILTNLKKFFFEYNGFRDIFPYINNEGIFVAFPILLLPFIFPIISKKYREELKKNNLVFLSIMLLISIIIISLFDIIFSAEIIIRYQFDFIYILFILSYLSIIIFMKTIKKEKILKVLKIILVIVLLLVVVKSILLFFIPDMYNFSWYFLGYE